MGILGQVVLKLGGGAYFLLDLVQELVLVDFAAAELLVDFEEPRGVRRWFLQIVRQLPLLACLFIN
jgi:hypothetical protein